MGIGYIPPKDKEGRAISRSSNVNMDEKYRVRHCKLFKATINASTSQDLDWLIPQLQYGSPGYPLSNVSSYMTGVRYKIVNGEEINPPEINFSIIDKDNVLGLGPNYILDTFSEDFMMFCNDADEIREHRAELIPGLYIRAHIDNVGNQNITFLCNLLRYIETVGIA